MIAFENARLHWGKITEILVAENSNRPVIELSIDGLDTSFGDPRSDITHGFPLTSNSLGLFSHEILHN